MWEPLPKKRKKLQPKALTNLCVKSCMAKSSRAPASMQTARRRGEVLSVTGSTVRRQNPAQVIYRKIKQTQFRANY